MKRPTLFHHPPQTIYEPLAPTRTFAFHYLQDNCHIWGFLVRFLPADRFVCHHPERITIRRFCRATRLQPELPWSNELGLIHRSALPIEYKLDGKYVAASEIIVRKPKSVRRARPVGSISMLSFIRKNSRTGKQLSASKTYAFEISVDHSPLVNIDQSCSNVSAISPNCSSVHSKRSENLDDKHTRYNRSTFGFPLKNSLMFPSITQSETIANCDPDIVTPMRGMILGWRRDFHVTASLQNLYMRHRQRSSTRGGGQLITDTKYPLQVV